MTPGSLEIRPFGPTDDLDAELDLRRRAFGPVSAAARPRWVAGLRHCIDAGQMVGVFDGSRLVASARYFAMQQWWLGRGVPMAGVAGVKVAPELRGRGLGRQLMAGLIDVITARGYPVSALYPATAPLYRSLGWELAGGKYETVLPVRSVAGLIPPDLTSPGPAGGQDLRRLSAADSAEVVQVLGRVHESLRDCGPAVHESDYVGDWLDDEDRFGYLASDGVLCYRWADGTSRLQVELLVAASAATARAFWHIVASHASMARSITASLPPDDPVSWLTREPTAAIRRADVWMLRVMDVPAAVAARGFPAAASVSVQLELTDDVLPVNSGRWRLQVSEGMGKIAPAAGGERDPVLRMGARGFAALYAGLPVGTLRRAGLATGQDSTADAALDCAFGGRPAFMLHGF